MVSPHHLPLTLWHLPSRPRHLCFQRQLIQIAAKLDPEQASLHYKGIERTRWQGCGKSALWVRDRDGLDRVERIVYDERPAAIDKHGFVLITNIVTITVATGGEGGDVDPGGGEQGGGQYYYATWDGKNKDGQKVASGIYYGIVSIPGVKAKNATFKMAVIK